MGVTSREYQKREWKAAPNRLHLDFPSERMLLALVIKYFLVLG